MEFGTHFSCLQLVKGLAETQLGDDIGCHAHGPKENILVYYVSFQSQLVMVSVLNYLVLGQAYCYTTTFCLFPHALDCEADLAVNDLLVPRQTRVGHGAG